MEITIQVEGEPVQAHFSNCVLYTSGEFGGNIDLQAAFNQPVPDQEIVENLRLRMPGKRTLLGVTAFGDLDSVTEVTFFTESELAPIGKPIPDAAVPAEVEILWISSSTSRPVATIPVTPEAGDPDDVQPGDYKLSDYRLDSEGSGGSGCASSVLAVLALIVVIVWTMGSW